MLTGSDYRHDGRLHDLPGLDPRPPQPLHRHPRQLQALRGLLSLPRSQGRG